MDLRIIHKLLLLALTFLHWQIAIATPSRNFFISPTGDDNNTGTSPKDPVKSIALVIAAALPGDTIYLLPGSYAGPIIFSAKKGSPDKPIYVYGYGQSPVIDGRAPRPMLKGSYHWIDIRNSAWLEIGNISFERGWTDPILVDNSSFISFKNCHFSGGRKVIVAKNNLTHHLLIENCTWDQGGEELWLLKNDAGGMDAWTSMHHGDLAFYNGSLVELESTSGSIVIRNNIIRNAFNAIRFSGTPGQDGNVEITGNSISNMRDNDFEPEEYTFNLYIHHNVSRNIHKTMSVDNVAGGYIYYFGNQVMQDSSAWAHEVCTGFWKVYGTERKLSYPMYAFNNSFFGNERAFTSMEGPASLFRHFNNAYFFSGSRTWDLNEWDTSDVFDHDVSNKPWPANITAHGQEAHGKIADPGYINPLRGDLGITENSAAKDAGKIIVLPELHWTQHYKGKSPDAGAFEGQDPIDGPAFQFMNPPDVHLPYKESPRIVKHETDNNKLILYFSQALNTSGLTAASVILEEKGQVLPVKKIYFPDKRTIVIVTGKQLNKDEVALNFRKRPVSIYGQPVTLWASTIGIAGDKPVSNSVIQSFR